MQGIKNVSNVSNQFVEMVGEAIIQDDDTRFMEDLV